VLGCDDEDYPDIEVTSIAFGHGETIPSPFTCDGENLSPPLTFDGFVPDARTIAVIMDDPDATVETFNHWVIWDIPVSKSYIEEGLPNIEKPIDKVKQGKNSADLLGYKGPCPPDGEEHRYYFQAYALDTEKLDLKGGATKEQLKDAMDGRIVGYGELKGLYER